MSATLQIAEGDTAVADAGDGSEDGAGAAGSETSEQRIARARSPHLFNAESAREAAARSVASRREKRTEREAAAELDRLSVIARSGVAAARAFTFDRQLRILVAMADKAEQGSIQAAIFCRDWIVKLGTGTADDMPGDVLDPADMSPAQRAAVRAALLQSLAAPHAEGTEGSEEPA